jgi:hypothetical protein
MMQPSVMISNLIEYLINMVCNLRFPLSYVKCRFQEDIRTPFQGVIKRKKANKENGRVNHAKHPLIGVWQISYTAGAKVNAHCGRGRMVPPLFI